MQINFLVLAIAAMIPMAMGFIWYNPKTLFKPWMESADLTVEKIESGNMALIFGLSYVFSFLLAIGVYFMVVHQTHVWSVLSNETGLNEPGSAIYNYYTDFMTRFGTHFRTFKHGALHGTVGGFLVSLPIIAVNALFERKGFKYIAINAGYWIITMALMGGVICQFA